jgi:hypothetical protein
MSLRLRKGLLREAFSILREHGAGRSECVVYLTGARSEPGQVDEVLHPVHLARPGFYEIDGAWLTNTWIDLARKDREVRVQVHTHREEAFHSKTDDDFPLLQTEGFLSLVIPEFATGPIGLTDSFLAELQGDGRWLELNPTRELVTE